VNLNRQARVLRASWPILLGSALVAGLIGFVVASAQPRSYDASATLIVGQELSGTNPDYSQLLVSQRLSTTYAAIATTGRILDQVIARENLSETSQELSRRVDATAATDSSLLTIVVRDTDPRRAAATANGIADELIASTPVLQGEAPEEPGNLQQDLQGIRAQIEATQAEIDTLVAINDRSPDQQRRLDTLQSQLVTLWSSYTQLLGVPSSEPANLLTVVQPATAPEEPVGPSPLLTALLAGLLGLLVAAAVVFGLDLADDSLRTPEEVRELVDLPTLGVIERVREGTGGSSVLATVRKPRSPLAEEYRSLRTNVEFAADGQLEILLVTSALPQEGKTMTASNLAAAFAQNDRRVVLVDGDLRRRGISQAFRVATSEGLSGLLRREQSVVEGMIHSTEAENLDVLPAGPLPPNPAELLASPRMRTIVSELSTMYDLVVIDGPPLEAVADAAVLGSIARSTLLVVDSRRSRRAPLRRARETLDRAGASILGVVLNSVAAAPSSRYYDFADRSLGSAPDAAPSAGAAPLGRD